MLTKLTSLFAPHTAKLEKSINEIPDRQYYMALALFVLVILKFVFLPWFEQVNTRYEQLQQMADTTKSPRLMLEQTQNMQQALIDKEQLHKQWLTHFYQGSTSQVKVAVVNKLQSSAKARKLLFLRSRWLRTPADRAEEFSTMEPLLYSVLVRGDYNEVRKLIQEWQMFEPFVRIEEIKVERRQDVGVIAATFKIAVFRLKQDEPSTGVAN